MAELTNEQVEQIRSELLSSFARFGAALSGKDWFDPGLHTRLCTFLQFGGREKGIALPRSFLKTTFTSTYYALWRAIEAKINRGKDLRILLVSNTAPNAEKTIQQIRGIVENHPIIQQFFPDIIPSFNNTQWSNRAASLVRNNSYPEATFESAGVGTAIIRRHFDIIIEDDTIAPSKDAITGNEALPSKEEIEKAIGFHKLTTPLFVDPVNAGEHESIFVGTRWGQADVIGYVKEHEKSYHWFEEKAFNEEGKPNYFRYNEEALSIIKEKMGTFMFSMLYLNSPISSEQQKFKQNWIRYYKLFDDKVADDKVILPDGGRMVLTGDPADPPTGKAKQDYTALVMGYHHPMGLFVRSYSRKRLRDEDIYKEAIKFCQIHNCNTIYLEKNRAANMIYGLKDAIRKANLFIQVLPIHNSRAKEDRIMALVPIMESGRLFLLPGMRELEEEFTVFPYGAHDDLIDALAMQMIEYKNIAREVAPQAKPDEDFTFESILAELEGKNRTGWFNRTDYGEKQVTYTSPFNGLRMINKN